MAFMQWSPELDIGVNVIDNQHKRIVEYLNELYDANIAGSINEISHVLDELVDYTVTHFAFEEELQEKAGYLFLKAHKRVHEIFAKRVVEFQNRSKAGENVGEEVLSMLKIWLVNHIKGDDADYSESVKQMLNEEQGQNENSGWLGASLKRLFG
jgi:hemerythrin